MIFDQSISLNQSVTQLLVIILAVETLWTVQTTILRAAIGLAATSVLVSILMFQMGAPLAAAFELSVCAGLITVVFVSTITMTRPQSDTEAVESAAVRAKRFHPSFIIVGVIGLALWGGSYVLHPAPLSIEPAMDVNKTMWSQRWLDLVGQIIIMLVGAYGVVVLFKDHLLRKSEPGKETAR